ncbi:MAG: hypothetical protein ACI9NY_001092 [Kiritimatiellia bacterium]
MFRDALKAKAEANSGLLAKPSTLPFLLTLITYLPIGNEKAGYFNQREITHDLFSGSSTYAEN